MNRWWAVIAVPAVKAPYFSLCRLRYIFTGAEHVNPEPDDDRAADETQHDLDRIMLEEAREAVINEQNNRD